MAEGKGLLDFISSPAGQGLLAAGFGALAGRGTRAQAIGQGGLAGLLAYGQATDGQRQAERQRMMDERQNEMFGWQRSAYQQQQESARKAHEQQAAQQTYLGSLGKITSPRIDAQPNQADPRQMLGLGFSPEFISTYMNAGNLGKAKIKDFKEIRNPDGSVSVVGFDEFGNVTNTKQTPFKAPDVRDFGGYVGGIDPITGKVSNYGQKTMSEAERDASARGWASVNQSGQRLALDKRMAEDVKASGGYSSKPLPASALKMQNDAIDVIAASSNIDRILAQKEQQIKSGALEFGPVDNLLNKGRNMAGMSTERSRNFASFMSDLERMRNESLRLNAGVQTDGDAQRAWNELFQNINDTNLVMQRLREIREINRRGVELQKLKIDQVRSNFNASPFDYSAIDAKQPAPSQDGWSIRPK